MGFRNIQEQLKRYQRKFIPLQNKTHDKKGRWEAYYHIFTFKKCYLKCSAEEPKLFNKVLRSAILVGYGCGYSKELACLNCDFCIKSYNSLKKSVDLTKFAKNRRKMYWPFTVHIKGVVVVRLVLDSRNLLMGTQFQVL